MTQVFRDPSAGWAALLVVLLPLLIIGIGEVEERLRQHDSALRRSVSIVRTWVVPLLAVWALSAVLFAPGADNIVLRAVQSALVISTSAAGLAALGVLVTMLRDRPRSDGRRAVPRLLLAMPRLLVLLITVWTLVAGVWSVNLSSAMTALGVTSLVVSFALQDTLGGIASGFTLLADQPFQPGDWISAGDVHGKVIDVNWRSSRIATRDGDLVVVPNGQLAKATITNFDQPARLHRVVVSLQVAFSNPPTAAKDMLLAAARATPGVLEDPAPAVQVVQIDDPLMGYEVHLWVDDYGIVPTVKSDFGSLVWYHSYRYNVPLPSPAQDLYLWDGDKVAVQSRPDHASILQGLQKSQLLVEIDDDDLDRLAIAATAHRFARGETITESGGKPELSVLINGQAQLVLRRPEHIDITVLALEAGDLLGDQHASWGDEHGLAVIAVTDCEVTSVTSEAAGAVIARSTALATALDQINTSRRRRVERTVRRIAQQRQLLDLQVAPAQVIDSGDEGIAEEQP